MTGPALTLAEQHALELRDAGVHVDEVVRVHAPYDTGEPAEVLFMGRLSAGAEPEPLTGYLLPGAQPRVVSGW